MGTPVPFGRSWRDGSGAIAAVGVALAVIVTGLSAPA
jgi:hypothetical protein